MYAVQVILRPLAATGPPPAGADLDRLATVARTRLGPPVEHVTLRARDGGLLAMTFVTGPDLLAAEKAARKAWSCGIGEVLGSGWQVVAGSADLLLTVWAAHDGMAAGGH